MQSELTVRWRTAYAPMQLDAGEFDLASISPGTGLRLKALLARSDAFRWLWSCHDGILEWRQAEKAVKIWAEMSRIANAQNVPITRAALYNTWRDVERLWALAPPELRTADICPPKLRTALVAREENPVAVGAAVRPRPEISPPPDDDEFQLVSVKKGVSDGR